MGGSDQWGNITTGTELIRRKSGREAFALTCPLITKADGGKFGKTESGNIWLDAERTSPYKFYQFWLNTSDVDAEKYIKIFTMLGKDEIDALVAAQAADPSQRPLQKRLADEFTTMVHGNDALQSAIEASQILFGKGSTETLRNIDEATFLSVFEGVPTFEISLNELSAGIDVAELLTNKAAVYPSKSELRRNIAGLQINKEKIAAPEAKVDASNLLNNKYLLVQKGKKNYYVLVAK